MLRILKQIKFPCPYGYESPSGKIVEVVQPEKYYCMILDFIGPAIAGDKVLQANPALAVTHVMPQVVSSAIKFNI